MASDSAPANFVVVLQPLLLISCLAAMMSTTGGAAAAVTVNQLSCYSCSSTANKGCKSSLDTTQVGLNGVVFNCSSCYKIRLPSSEYTRGCGPSFKTGCWTIKDRNSGRYMTVCYCEQNLCNDAVTAVRMNPVDRSAVVHVAAVGGALLSYLLSNSRPIY